MPELYAPLLTPFRDDESLDADALTQNVAWYDRCELTGYVLNGTSGEADMLTFAEHLEVARVVRQATQRRLLFGLVAQSLHTALKQMEQIAELGVDAVLARTPSCFGKQLDQVDFYIALAEASPLPVLIYQIPQNTGVRLTPEVLEELAEHPKILGIKDSLGDLALLQGTELPEDFAYYFGNSNLILAALQAGATGGILGLANVKPRLCGDLIKAFEAGDLPKALAAQRRLIILGRILGSSNGFGLAGLKAGLEMEGFRAGKPRRPLKRLSQAQYQQLEDLLESL